MPFCTKCGANVTGVFCSQCGIPVAEAGAAPPPTVAPPYAQAALPGVPPTARKTSPIVWVLVIVLGFFVLGGLGFAAFVGYIAHRVHHDGFTLQTNDHNGKRSSIHIGGKADMPAWVPVYPGSGRSNFSITGSGENGEGGTFIFTTSDDPERVKSFYSDKARELGMKVTVAGSADAGVITAEDDGGDQRSLVVEVGGHSRQTTVHVTYGRK